MKESQVKKLEMYLKTRSVLEKNTTNWSNAIEVKNILDEFYSNTDKIIELENEYKKDISEILNNKTIITEDLINQSMPIINVLQVYAYDTKNNNLKKKVNLSHKDFKKSKDSDLVNKVKSTFKIAKELYGKSIEDDSKSKKKSGDKLVNLSGYGISGLMIDELEDVNKKFIESATIVRDSINYRNNCAKKITEKIKNNDKLLLNRLDKVMTLNQNNNNDFYNAYKESRIIEVKEKIEKVTQIEDEKIASNNVVENPTVEVTKTETSEVKKTPTTTRRSASTT